MADAEATAQEIADARALEAELGPGASLLADKRERLTDLRETVDRLLAALLATGVEAADPETVQHDLMALLDKLDLCAERARALYAPSRPPSPASPTKPRINAPHRLPRVQHHLRPSGGHGGLRLATRLPRPVAHRRHHCLPLGALRRGGLPDRHRRSRLALGPQRRPAPGLARHGSPVRRLRQ